ncbi:NUDIX hydrolase [Allokutzneria sp. A3M-2-11 16]|uniref:NUDIX domain-containing protein n=1 Tax=Allokutzneria sp. A3M-2-11 16 TaxID=2962043 RepID=UPI0020B7B608|nr:NUDIX domain-containing protein [Allokutzneria sp. A3M-2-11 16]MCP3801904.1 NUDIX hydrolase [Allokutzneria sp. A3M-2-11 16]
MSPVKLTRASAVVFERIEPQRHTADEESEIAAYWAAALDANPRLFDGPVVVVRSVTWQRDTCLVRWSPGTYAHYLWRYVPGEHRFARILFASAVLTTLDGKLLLGVTAPGTSEPGRLQLSGGNVEPPASGRPLTSEVVAEEAVRELAEETGVTLSRDTAELWMVKEDGDYGDVGLFYRVPSLATAEIQEAFTRHRAELSAKKEFSEFESLAFVDVPNADDPRRCVDYLPDLLQRL